jgi:hypothetical protein
MRSRRAEIASLTKKPTHPPHRRPKPFDGCGSSDKTTGVSGRPVQARVAGDFSPGFEQLIDIPYLAEPQAGESCDRKGPFTAFVIAGPYSSQRKLSGSEVGCFRGG